MVKRNDIFLPVILGPTASGKSAWAVELADEHEGEIVSADSRQVYRGLDIGSGKITKDEMRGIPHHLLDVAEVGSRFTVAQYKSLAERAIADISKRGQLPFLVGGSALYLDVVIENYQLPLADQDINYRSMLGRLEIDELCAQLEQVDPILFGTIDKLNKRRIIRGLEVFHLTGKPLSQLKKRGSDMYQSSIFGIDMPRKQLYDRIDVRVDSRIEEGMIEEVESLLLSGVSLEWLVGLGLEYRLISLYLNGPERTESSKRDMIQKLKYAIHDFARRQLIWFRARKNIQLCTTLDEMRSRLNLAKASLKQL